MVVGGSRGGLGSWREKNIINKGNVVLWGRGSDSSRNTVTVLARRIAKRWGRRCRIGYSRRNCWALRFAAGLDQTLRRGEGRELDGRDGWGWSRGGRRWGSSEHWRGRKRSCIGSSRAWPARGRRSTSDGALHTTGAAARSLKSVAAIPGEKTTRLGEASAPSSALLRVPSAAEIVGRVRESTSSARNGAGGETREQIRLQL